MEIGRGWKQKRVLPGKQGKKSVKGVKRNEKTVISTLFTSHLIFWTLFYIRISGRKKTPQTIKWVSLPRSMRTTLQRLCTFLARHTPKERSTNASLCHSCSYIISCQFNVRGTTDRSAYSPADSARALSMQHATDRLIVCPVLSLGSLTRSFHRSVGRWFLFSFFHFFFRASTEESGIVQVTWSISRDTLIWHPSRDVASNPNACRRTTHTQQKNVIYATDRRKSYMLQIEGRHICYRPSIFQRADVVYVALIRIECMDVCRSVNG